MANTTDIEAKVAAALSKLPEDVSFRDEFELHLRAKFIEEARRAKLDVPALRAEFKRLREEIRKLDPRLTRLNIDVETLKARNAAPDEFVNAAKSELAILKGFRRPNHRWNRA